MRAFITGGTGFVGNNLARKLISDGNKVGLLIRENCKTWRTNDLKGKVDFLKGDLTDKNGLIELIKNYNPDFVYNLATYGNFISTQKDENKIILTNLGGTINLLDAIDERPLINIGSSSEYGIKTKAMKETDTCKPDNWYGKIKLAQTLYCKEQEIPTLRIFSAYGPWQEPSQLIPTLIKSKLNGKELHLIESVRDHIYVDDVIDAISNATKKYDGIKGEIINLGSGQQHLTREVLEELNKIDSREIEIKWNFKPVQTEPNVWTADISKAKELLGWEPKINFEEGLKKTYDWFRENLNRGLK